MRHTALSLLTVLTLSMLSTQAQSFRMDARSWRGNLVMPQSRTFAVTQAPVVKTTRVDVRVDILEQVATTTMDVSLQNPANSRQEAQLMVPVPDGAVVRGFTFQGSAAEPTAQTLPKGEAREIYNAIVAKMKDPALLEFVGYNMIRSSVFPVEAGSTQKVRLTYETVLPAVGKRVDYVLPRSETLSSDIPWHISASVCSTRAISTIYSPTHDIATRGVGPGKFSVALTGHAGSTQPGLFQLSYLLEGDGVSASLFAYPDPKRNGGYFLLLAGLPSTRPPADAIKREITLAYDRSGSMNGPKLKQARESALQILAGLNPGETFNIITYNESVDSFAPHPVKKTERTIQRAREFINGMTARGGTNIHDALLEALRQKPTPGYLPIVLFLTDGIPTIGQTSEKEIRALVEKHNTHDRRVFTFGVGADVNAPLLDRIADVTRATTTYVLPGEDVELKVATVFERLAGPVLSSPRLRFVDTDGRAAIGRVTEMLPSRIPDLFHGDQLILFGKYRGEAPLNMTLKGDYLGKPRTFEFAFDLDAATTRNAFVPRLWASRKIAVLIDQIRQTGENGHTGTILPGLKNDPRFKELIDEIVALSTEFGILTEYTAFLAREGTDLSDNQEILNVVRHNMQQRAINTRSGLGAVNQGMNYQEQSHQKSLKKHNDYWDHKMDRVQVSDVEQVNDRTYYRRGQRWIDSSVVTQSDQKPDKVIDIGSNEFFSLAERLAAQNRAGAMSLKGELLIRVDGDLYLCR